MSGGQLYSGGVSTVCVLCPPSGFGNVEYRNLGVLHLGHLEQLFCVCDTNSDFDLLWVLVCDFN